MKRVLSFLLLTLIMSVTVLCAVSCGATAEAKLGVGAVVSGSSKDASAEAAGSASISVTAAATLFDKNGKLIACDIDVIDAKVALNADGTYTIPETFKTKRELGDDYGMAMSEGQLEWYEQAHLFERFAKGKTLDEIKNLIDEKGYGAKNVQAAGCTINAFSFVLAIEASVSEQKTVTVPRGEAVTLTLTPDVKGKAPVSSENGVFDMNIGAKAAVGEENITVIYEKDYAFDATGKFIAAE